MTDLIDVELFIAMDENAEFVVVTNESDALSELSGLGGNQARVVKVTVKMRPPQMAEASVTVPDDVGTEVPQPTAA